MVYKEPIAIELQTLKTALQILNYNQFTGLLLRYTKKSYSYPFLVTT